MSNRPLAFWLIFVFLIVSLLQFIAGQTLAVFNYELTVQMGFQEAEQLITPFGVRVNRAFAVADTLVYIPLIIFALTGLFLKKRWSLLLTAAVMGISAYWATTTACMFLFLQDVASYTFIPPPTYWVFVSTYILFGILGIIYLLVRGEKLIAK